MLATLSRVFDRIIPSRKIPIARLGGAGEGRAVWFYRWRGYEIAGRNVKLTGGEIDLIARRGKTIVFVEVKTRQQTEKGAPYEAVDRAKQIQVAALAGRYLARERIEELTVRFDVLSLLWDGRRFRIEHFENAFALEADPRYPWKMK